MLKRARGDRIMVMWQRTHVSSMQGSLSEVSKHLCL